MCSVSCKLQDKQSNSIEATPHSIEFLSVAMNSTPDGVTPDGVNIRKKTPTTKILCGEVTSKQKVFMVKCCQVRIFLR